MCLKDVLPTTGSASFLFGPCVITGIQEVIYVQQELIDLYRDIAGKSAGDHSKAAYASCLRFIDRVPPRYQDHVLCAVALHDIGKSRKDAQGEHHAVTGYKMLNHRVSELSRYLVLTHTDSMEVVKDFDFASARVRLGCLGVECSSKNMEVLKACVTLADLTAGHLGGVVGFKERLASIEERHGKCMAEPLPELFYNACATLNLEPEDFE